MDEDDFEIEGRHQYVISDGEGSSSPIQIDSESNSDVLFTEGSDEEEEIQIVRPSNPTPPEFNRSDPPLPTLPSSLLLLQETDSTLDGAVQGTTGGLDLVPDSSTALVGDGSGRLDQHPTNLGEVERVLDSENGNMNPSLTNRDSGNSDATNRTRIQESSAISDQVNSDNSSQNGRNAQRASNAGTSSVFNDVVQSAEGTLTSDNHNSGNINSSEGTLTSGNQQTSGIINSRLESIADTASGSHDGVVVAIGNSASGNVNNSAIEITNTISVGSNSRTGVGNTDSSNRNIIEHTTQAEEIMRSDTDSTERNTSASISAMAANTLENTTQEIMRRDSDSIGNSRSASISTMAANTLGNTTGEIIRRDSDSIGNSRSASISTMAANTLGNTTGELIRSDSDSAGRTTSTPANNLITVSIPRSSVNSPSSATPLRRDIIDLGEHNRSMEEFRTPKKRKLMTPENKKAKSPAKEESDEDGDTCPICFELWTISGAHRLVSLKCGHLFGQSCIEKWLRGQGGKCPHCNAKAKRQDIRVVYAKSIKALDTTERDQALRDLETEREAKRRVELEAAQFRLKYHQLLEECNSLRTERDELKREVLNLRDSTGSTHHVIPASQSASSTQLTQLCRQSFQQSRTINVSDTGKCRVLAYSSLLGALLVSQPSNSQLFKGFGVKKISTMDFKTNQFLTIHSKAIRDIAFHPVQDDGILLSCGTDKCVKMTNLMSNSVVQTYECASPVWSCVWNTDDKCYFYVGLQNGTVLEYDTRNTVEAVQEINKDGSKSPVVSLQYIPKADTAHFKCEGLLVGQLDRTSFFEKKTGSEMKLHLLPLDGSLTSLCFERSTRQLLASFRPSSKYLHARHQVCRMSTWQSESQTMEESCTCTPIHTFKGSSTQAMLSRSTLFPTGDDVNRLIVCAGDEPSSMVFTWDSVTGKQVQRMSSGGVAVDMLPLDLPDQKCLATLTEKQVKIFNWT